MAKSSCIGILISLGFAGPIFSSGEIGLVQDLLANEVHALDDLMPLEIQLDLGSFMLQTHPAYSFMLKELLQTNKSLMSHSVKVSSAASNKAGNRIVTSSYDGAARIWDAASGVLLKTLEGHGLFVNSACFNTNGDKVVTASRDTTLKIWDVAIGECVCTLVGHTGNVFLAGFNESGDRVFTASRDQSVKIWNAATGECLVTLEVPDRLTHAQFNFQGNKILMARGDHAALCDVNRLLFLNQFLKSEVTHRQALLFIALYEIVLCRELASWHGARAFKNREKTRSKGELLLDLNKFSSLQEAFSTLSQEIQTIIRPYVREPLSQALTHGIEKNRQD